MTLLPCALPVPPRWQVDWSALNESFAWIRAMRGCPQDPIFHAEGDVWIHVRMVCEAMAASVAWQSLPALDREVLFAAALLHDVAKPRCTRQEAGRITSRGHSHHGAIAARKIMWQHGADFTLREHVCALVRHHQTPFYLIDRPDAARTAFSLSQSLRCELLAVLADADATGRICADQKELLLRIELFRQFCAQHQCLSQPRGFTSGLPRFEYFRSASRDPDYAAFDSSRCEVILMSGLPAAGKDHWIRHHAPSLPVISLDSIREEIGAPPTGNQGPVLQLARERARALLRRGDAFVWNATNLSREIRGPLIDLFTAYQARTRIVYVESPPDRLFAQNASRPRIVPPPAIERMIERWEVPTTEEAPTVEHWENGPAGLRLFSVA